MLSTNEQCREIADVLARAKTALAEPLPANPPASKLQAKAHLYRDLGTQLKRLRLDKDLDKSRDPLVKHLQTVAQHLDQAAGAVAQSEKDQNAADNAPPSSSAASPTPGPTAGTLRSKQRSQVRRYIQAKTEIEAASVKIGETMRTLHLDCH